MQPRGTKQIKEIRVAGHTIHQKNKFIVRKCQEEEKEEKD